LFQKANGHRTKNNKASRSMIFTDIAVSRLQKAFSIVGQAGDVASGFGCSFLVCGAMFKESAEE